MTARVSMLLKSRASLTCFRACFLPGRAKDLSAPRYLIHELLLLLFETIRVVFRLIFDFTEKQWTSQWDEKHRDTQKKILKSGEQRPSAALVYSAMKSVHIQATCLPQYGRYYINRDWYPIINCVSHVSKGNDPRMLHWHVWSGAGEVLTTGSQRTAISRSDIKFCYYTN